MEVTEFRTGNVPFLAADGFGSKVAHGFSTRQGGVSEGIYASLNLGMNRGDAPERVRENYTRFCAAVGVQTDKLVFSNQVHGDGVRVCTSADAGFGLERRIPYEADALVTDVPGLALVVFSADCLPVLLYDPERAVVAAIHAGWRGTALGIVEKTVETMISHYGCQAESLLAAIGPGISRCCFETQEDVPNAMTEAMGSSALRFLDVREGGRFKVDLKGLNTLRLERMGVLRSHIAVSDACTSCLPEQYWSHRYTHGQRGSMAAVIALKA